MNIIYNHSCLHLHIKHKCVSMYYSLRLGNTWSGRLLVFVLLGAPSPSGGHCQSLCPNWILISKHCMMLHMWSVSSEPLMNTLSHLSTEMHEGGGSVQEYQAGAPEPGVTTRLRSTSSSGPAGHHGRNCLHHHTAQVDETLVAVLQQQQNGGAEHVWTAADAHQTDR